MSVVVAALLGIVLAFIGSIPIAGPLAVLIVDRAVAGKKVEGLFIALGGAVAEAVYAFGVAALFPLLLGLSHNVVLISRIAGASLVAIAGAVLFFRPTAINRTPARRRSGSFLAGLVLSGANPTLFATWTVVVATLNAHALLARTFSAAVAFGLGVGAGVTGWFAVLVSLSSAAGNFLHGHRRVQVIRSLGLLLMCVGVYLVVHSFRSAGSAA